MCAFICGRAKGRTIYTLLYYSHDVINSSFQVMHVRNFVCVTKMFDLEQLWLSRKDVRLENVKIIA